MKKTLAILLTICLMSVSAGIALAADTADIVLNLPEVNADECMVDVYHITNAEYEISAYVDVKAGEDYEVSEGYEKSLVGTYLKYDISISGAPEGYLVSFAELYLDTDESMLTLAKINDDFEHYSFTVGSVGSVAWTRNNDYAKEGKISLAMANGNGMGMRTPLLSLYFTLTESATAGSEIAITCEGFRIGFVTADTNETQMPEDNVSITMDNGSVSVRSMHDVTYVADGTTVASYTVADGQTLAEIPAVPAKVGYTGAWDIDLDGVAITENKTVTAVYTINKYIVTYTADGVTVGEYTVEHGGTLSEIPAVPAKVGYTGAWDVDLEGAAITENKTVTAVYTLIPDVKYGDADCNGSVNSSDASEILRYLVSLSKLTEQGMKNADCDGIKGVTAGDASAILRYLVGLNATLPPE